jgi:hypothetical protein
VKMARGWMLAGLVLVTSHAGAEGWRAGPPRAPGIVAAAKKAGKLCSDRLANQVYRCQTRAESGATFEDCFRFSSPGLVSDKFDVVIDGLDGATLGCTCKAKGTPKKARFNALPAFVCTGDADATSFEGTVSRNGKKIVKGFAANPAGGSFVYTCTVDPACAVAP